MGIQYICIYIYWYVVLGENIVAITVPTKRETLGACIFYLLFLFRPASGLVDYMEYIDRYNSRPLLLLIAGVRSIAYQYLVRVYVCVRSMDIITWYFKEDGGGTTASYRHRVYLSLNGESSAYFHP